MNVRYNLYSLILSTMIAQKIEFRREFWQEQTLEQIWVEYYADGSTLASMDVVVPSLYIIWLGFWITRVQVGV